MSTNPPNEPAKGLFIDSSDEHRTSLPSSLLHGRTAMATNSGFFADASNFELRYVPDYATISQIADAQRVLGSKVVLTRGTFDILHEGHSMYLEAARRFGHFLIVGVDSDEKVRRRKGIWRPVVPESERLRM